MEIEPFLFISNNGHGTKEQELKYSLYRPAGRNLVETATSKMFITLVWNNQHLFTCTIYLSHSFLCMSNFNSLLHY